ncbi:MAG: ABC transporter ATP-binding protein [Sphingobacteriales bacterium]|nr:ABC transporter ATP-binding protein [Sphingobacteriales bacterium]
MDKTKEKVVAGVVVENIIKTYGKKKDMTALNDISFDVQKGELFGLIGPDGAGKTSLFRILTTLLLADSGKATVDGFDVVKDYKAIRKRVGYMPGRFSLYPDLSVEENLNFFATIFNTSIEENYDLVKDIYVQIEPFKKRKAGKLSGGMKQKLALSCALIHRPSVLFLDEPTTGVDAVSRKEFWEMLKGLKQQGITILVSTPYMDEARLCDRIALIQNGKILSINSPQGIVNDFSKPLWAVKSDRMLHLQNELQEKDFVENVYPFGEFHHVVMKNESGSEQLRNFITAHSSENAVLQQVKPDIEDCFIDLMKN